MAETLPINFPFPQESAVATYNYTDIVNGTGVAEFEIFDHTSGSSTIGYNLTSNPVCSVYGYKSESEVNANGTAWNYDLTPFNSPRTINGKCIVYFVWGVHKSSGSHEANGYFTVRLYRVAVGGGSSTLISDEVRTFDMTSGGNNNQWAAKTNVTVLTVTNQKFGVGESLRLSFTYTQLGGSSGAGTACWILGTPDDGDVKITSWLTIHVGDDGSSGVGTGGNLIRTTRARLFVPFKIET